MPENGTNSLAAKYICELCDTCYPEKHQIAIHKHRVHGLQLLIQARERALLSPPPSEPTAVVTNAHEQNLPSAPQEEKNNSEKSVATTAEDVRDEEMDTEAPPSPLALSDDGNNEAPPSPFAVADDGNNEGPPSPQAPHGEDLDQQRESLSNQVVLVDNEASTEQIQGESNDVGAMEAGNTSKMTNGDVADESSNKSRLTNKKKRKQSVAKPEKVIPFSRPTKGSATNKSKQSAGTTPSKLQREMRLLETNSSMRVDPDEIEFITSRKRANSSSSNPEHTPKLRRAAVQGREKMKLYKEELLVADDDLPLSIRQSRSRTPSKTFTSTPKEATSTATKNLFNSLTSEEPNNVKVYIRERDLELVDGKLECVYCFSWIKMDNVNRYFKHMTNVHPEVKEDGWAITPPKNFDTSKLSPSKSTSTSRSSIEKENLNVTSAPSLPSGSFSSEPDKTLNMKVCPICDKRFKLVVQLKRHLDSDHDMMYCCDSAFSKDSFLDHQIEHELNDIEINIEISPEEETAIDLMSTPLTLIENNQNKANPETQVEEKEKKEDKAPNPGGKKAATATVPKYPSRCVRCIFMGTELTLYRHYRDHHKIFWCTGCTDVFSNMNDLEDHFNAKHTTEFNYLLKREAKGGSSTTSICSICNIDFKAKGRLIQHYQVDHNRTTCFICLKTFDTKSDMARHSRKCAERSCPVCPKKFAQTVQFVLHLFEHIHRDEMEDPREKIKDSQQATAVNQETQKTEERVKADTKKVEEKQQKDTISRCDTCLMSFVSVQLLAKHVKQNHKPAKSKPRKPPKKSSFAPVAVCCKTCDRDFMSAKYLNMHKCQEAQKQNTTPANDVSCGHCDLSFKSTQELQKHAESHIGN